MYCRRATLTVLSLCVSLMWGCADQVGDIDRTQPNKVNKQWLEGEWFFQQTVVDVPYTAEFTFVGEQQADPMDRIVWEIQEHYLYARRAREFVEGTERGQVPTAGPYQGAPLAAFSIEAHFDVQRDYSTSTGEQSNLLVENMEDRPWYEREWIRVDWSQNLVNDFDFFFTYGDLSRDSVVPISSYLDEGAEGDPDRTIVTSEYIDVVNRLFAEPALDCYDWNDDYVIGAGECDPACWYSFLYDCAGTEVRLRNSFLKVKPREFEARHYDDHELERFGYFRTERYRYDRQRGLTEPQRRFYQQHWDIWGRDHSDQLCASDADCGEGHGVVCDPVALRCTLPYVERVVKPIVYYTNAEFPGRYQQAAQEVVGGWNRAFQELVNALKYEGQRKLACSGESAEDPASCCSEADYAGGGAECVPHVFVLLENDCRVEQVDAFLERRPDLKELQERIAGGPPSNLDELKRVCAGLEHATLEVDDPLRSFRWQRPGDLRYSMLYWVDAPNPANPLGYGPSAADPRTGELISALSVVYGAEIEGYATQGLEIVQLLNGDLAEEDLIRGVNVRDYLDSLGSADRAAERRREVPPDERVRRLSALADAHRHGQERADRRSPPPAGARQAERAQRRERIRGTALEARMIPDDQRLLMGRSPADLGEPMTALEQARLSPLEMFHGRRMRKHQRGMKEAMRRNIYLRDFADDAVRGYAATLVGEDEETVWNTIATAVFKGVAEHEVGHTLGLRHNFSASTDALNYFPAYWGQRGELPQPFEEPTEAQIEGQMPLYQYASIMDYGANFYSDIKGLGAYDRAAISFGYGRMIPAFKSLHKRLTQRMDAGSSLKEVLERFHYTKLPEKFGGIDAMLDRELLPVGEAEEREVPFRFCSDEYAGAMPECDVWDRGADAYEIARYAADSYRAFYVFDAFKRERIGLDPWDYAWRIHERYFMVLMKLFQHWYYFDDGSEGWRQDPDHGAPLTLAAELGLRLFWDVLSTPSPGTFCYDEDIDAFTPESWWYGCDEGVEPVPLGEGRYPDVTFDWGAGYYFYEKVQSVGSFYDKAAAMDAMSYPDTAFIGIDTTSNLDAITFTFYDGFPRLMTQLFGGIMVERYDWFGPRVVERDGRKRVERYDPTLSGGGDELFQAATPVYPEIDFNLQTWAAWDAMAFFTMGWDQRFNDSARIYIKGSAEDATPADPERELSFEDPFSGRIYAALRYDPRFASPAAALIEGMNGLKTQWEAQADGFWKDYFESLLRYKIDLADTYRGLYEFYGKSY